MIPPSSIKTGQQIHQEIDDFIGIPDVYTNTNILEISNKKYVEAEALAEFLEDRLIEFKQGMPRAYQRTESAINQLRGK